MRRYRTEILIPPDRFIGLQLPASLPEGRAIVTIVVHEPEPGEAAAFDADPDRQDIEWWDEFEDDEPTTSAAPAPAPEPTAGPESGPPEPQRGEGPDLADDRRLGR